MAGAWQLFPRFALACALLALVLGCGGESKPDPNAGTQFRPVDEESPNDQDTISRQLAGRDPADGNGDTSPVNRKTGNASTSGAKVKPKTSVGGPTAEKYRRLQQLINTRPSGA